MPSHTFHNLPEEKRDRIIEAIKKEMTGKTLADVSINKIIKDAGISRGSFYQYFSDKTDMLECIISKTKDWLKLFISHSIRMNKGDIFRCFEDMLVHVEEYATEPSDMMAFHRSLLADHEMHEMFCSRFAKANITSLIEKEIEPYVDLSGITKEQREDFSIVIDLLIDISGRTLLDLFTYYDGTQDFEKVNQDFHRKMEILRRGVSEKM